MITTIVGHVRRNTTGYGTLIHRYERGSCSIRGCKGRQLLRSVLTGKLLCDYHRSLEVENIAEGKFIAFLYRQVNGKEFKIAAGPVLASTPASLAIDLTRYAKTVKANNWVRDPLYMCGGYYTNEDFTLPRGTQKTIVKIYLKAK